MMLQLTITPPLEHPHVRGLIAELSIANGAPSSTATIRARPYHAMDWMLPEAGSELKDVRPRDVCPTRAQALFAQVCEARLPLISSSQPGIHETSFCLRVFSAGSFCEYNWRRVAPSEWKDLDDIVSEIQSIAEEQLNSESP
ncbi:hypothetical protein [Chitinimonas sp.]|uniref:hypothetical protein n=1 Tax=Chitinimonas sp. TaxID=1934313 RepID=UPI0035B31B67